MNFKQIYNTLEKSEFPDVAAKQIIGEKNKFLTYMDIETILNKVEDKDSIAKLIIREKEDKLDGSDIQIIYKSGVKNVHEISKEIINTKKENLNEKDLIYIFHFDKNHEDLKEKLKEYFKEDVLNKAFKDVEYSYEAKLRKEIHNIIKESYLNNNFIKNGVVFIKGKKMENNKSNLYVTNVNSLNILDRKKKDNKERESAKMVSFGTNDVFKIIEEQGKLIPIKIYWKSNESMLEKLNLNKNSLVLNNDKTPYHWVSIKTENIKEAISKLSDSLKELEDIKWN